MIIEALKGMKKNLLEPLIFAALNYINENIMTIELRDPANSLNIITDRLTRNDRYIIKKITQQSLDLNYLGGIFTKS